MRSLLTGTMFYDKVSQCSCSKEDAYNQFDNSSWSTRRGSFSGGERNGGEEGQTPTEFDDKNQIRPRTSGNKNSQPPNGDTLRSKSASFTEGFGLPPVDDEENKINNKDDSRRAIIFPNSLDETRTYHFKSAFTKSEQLLTKENLPSNPG